MFKFKTNRERGHGSGVGLAREVPCYYSTTAPGVLILLLDQSDSMRHPWSNTGSSRMEVATSHANAMINRVLLDSQYGIEYRQRVWIAVFGYSSRNPDFSDAVRLIKNGWPADFKDSGGNWIRPEARGGTPMSLAFQGARQYLEDFFADPGRRERFSSSAPPIILNVTDGRANEFHTGDWAALHSEIERLWNVDTPQGFAPLVFHAHISDRHEDCQLFPASPKGLDEYGKRLFEIASPVPGSWIGASAERSNQPIEPGAVGLILNAGPDELMDLFILATDGGR